MNATVVALLRPYVQLLKPDIDCILTSSCHCITISTLAVFLTVYVIRTHGNCSRGSTVESKTVLKLYYGTENGFGGWTLYQQSTVMAHKVRLWRGRRDETADLCIVIIIL